MFERGIHRQCSNGKDDMLRAFGMGGSVKHLYRLYCVSAGARVIVHQPFCSLTAQVSSSGQELEGWQVLQRLVTCFR